MTSHRQPLPKSHTILSGEKKGGFDVDLSSGGGLMEMMGSFTVLRLTSMMGMANISFTKEDLLKMNKDLNKIRKPKELRNK